MPTSELTLKYSSDKAAERPAGAGSAALPLWLYLLFCILSMLPFVLVTYPAIVDFPNHTARLDLQCTMRDPLVAAMYRFQFNVIPNLAADLVNQPLCGLIQPASVLKGIILAALAAIYASCWHIQRRLFDTVNPFLLFVPAMSLNVVTTFGYINYLAGTAIAIAMIAFALSRSRSPSRALYLIGNIGGVLLFFAHIFALAFAIAFFFGWFLKKPVRVRRVIEAGLKTVAMFVLPLVLIPFIPAESGPLTISYFAKLRALFAPFLVHSGIQAVPLPVAIIIPFYLLYRRHQVRLHPRMRMPIALVAFYILAVPSQLKDAVDIDARTAVSLAYVAFASMAPPSTGRVAKLIAALAAMPLAFHLFTVTTVWVPFSRQVAELRAAYSILPAHANLLSVTREEQGTPNANNTVPMVAYSHLASFATIDRRVFNPLEFTGIGMQPLSASGRFASLDVGASMPIPMNTVGALTATDALQRDLELARHYRYAHRWQEHFDYVLYYHFGQAPNFAPPQLDLVRQGSFFSLLKVRKRLN